MDKVRIFKSSPLGKVRIPSSKSDAHRKIIAASMAFGQTSVIYGVDISIDIKATINAMRHFANIEIDGTTLIITSIRPYRKKAEFDACESGSTLRFLIPIFSHFFEETKIYARKSLLNRPLNVYKEIYQEALIINEDHVLVKHKKIEDDLVIKGNLSSQFITGFLFLLPHLENEVKIKVLPPYESKSYVDLTIGVMKEFNIDIIQNNNVYYLLNDQTYKACFTHVESDFSQLAFFATLGVINSTCEVEVVNKNTLQGDLKIIDFIKLFNGDVKETDKGYIFSKSKLKAANISLKDNPDLGPILFVLALFAEGTTHFYDTSRLRIKESDRIQSMKEEFKKFNVELIDLDNEVIISKQTPSEACEVISSHNDHRILMSLVILSTLLNETRFENVDCVYKSYPKFFDDLFSLKIEGEYYEYK